METKLEVNITPVTVPDVLELVCPEGTFTTRMQLGGFSDDELNAVCRRFRKDVFAKAVVQRKADAQA